MTTPNHHWRITETGTAQAACVGEYPAAARIFERNNL